MKNKTIILTSTGLSSEKVVNKFKDISAKIKNKSVTIITTAAEGKEQNKYSILAKKQFEDLGFTRVDFIDIQKDIITNFLEYSVIYVCGGNTFKLLKYAQESNLKNKLEDFLDNGGIYIGVSAGSIIVGPSIKIAGEISADINDVKLENLSGLNIIDIITLPHYSDELETEVQKFEKENSVKVTRINNFEALVVTIGLERIS